MKILILTFYFQPDLSAGAFRMTAFVDRLKGMLNSDDTVEIITTSPNRYHAFEREAPEQEQNDNIFIKRIKIPSHKSGMLDQSIAFTKYARGCLKYSKNRKYDLVLATSSRLFTAFLGAVISRRTKANLYLDIRDIFVETMEDILSGWKSLAIVPGLNLIEKLTVKSAKKINLVSQGFESYFTKKYPSGLFSFYPNGIDSEFLNHNFEKTESIDKTIILYAGNIGEGQGLHKIIPELARQLDDRYLIRIIGDGGAKNKLLQELNSFDDSKIELVNPVGREVLIDYYKQSDFLFLHLNDLNAFKRVLPSKLFEYAATGKPVLAGVNGYAREFVDENIANSITFTPCDADDLIAKLNDFESTNDKRSRFIERFSRDGLMDQLAQDFLDCTLH